MATKPVKGRYYLNLEEAARSIGEGLTYRKGHNGPLGELSSAVGIDATRYLAATMLWSAIRFHIRTGGKMRVTRMASPKFLLERATALTGKTYTGKAKFENAAADVLHWANTMKAALPQEVKE